MMVVPPHPTSLTNIGSKGCTNQGSGLRHIETGVAGFNNKGGQDWRLLCETMPMTWDHIKYTSPTYCEVSTNVCSCTSLR